MMEEVSAQRTSPFLGDGKLVILFASRGNPAVLIDCRVFRDPLRGRRPMCVLANEHSTGTLALDRSRGLTGTF